MAAPRDAMQFAVLPWRNQKRGELDVGRIKLKFWLLGGVALCLPAAARAQDAINLDLGSVTAQGSGTLAQQQGTAPYEAPSIAPMTRSSRVSTGKAAKAVRLGAWFIRRLTKP